MACRGHWPVFMATFDLKNPSRGNIEKPCSWMALIDQSLLTGYLYTFNNKNDPTKYLKWEYKYADTPYYHWLCATGVCRFTVIYGGCSEWSKKCCVRNRYLGQGQVITSRSICGMWLLTPALDAYFWHNTPELILNLLGFFSWNINMDLDLTQFLHDTYMTQVTDIFSLAKPNPTYM